MPNYRRTGRSSTPARTRCPTRRSGKASRTSCRCWSAEPGGSALSLPWQDDRLPVTRDLGRQPLPQHLQQGVRSLAAERSSPWPQRVDTGAQALPGRLERQRAGADEEVLAAVVHVLQAKHLRTPELLDTVQPDQDLADGVPGVEHAFGDDERAAVLRDRRRRRRPGFAVAGLEREPELDGPGATARR